MSERFERAMKQVRDFWDDHVRKNPDAPRVFLTPEFSRLLSALEAEDSIAVKNFCKVLIADPDKPKDGRNVNGTGCHKTYMNKAKRGKMLRVWYYHNKKENAVYFVWLLPKAKKGNLTDRQAKNLKETTTLIDAGKIQLISLLGESAE
jgi:mRNA-degrading endonuclease RelE of RelBE toxin-antitoxin system